MLLYAMHLVFHRQENSITNCNEPLIKTRIGLRRVQCMFEFDREGLKDCYNSSKGRIVSLNHRIVQLGKDL